MVDELHSQYDTRASLLYLLSCICDDMFNHECVPDTGHGGSGERVRARAQLQPSDNAEVTRLWDTRRVLLADHRFLAYSSLVYTFIFVLCLAWRYLLH